MSVAPGLGLTGSLGTFMLSKVMVTMPGLSASGLVAGDAAAVDAALPGLSLPPAAATRVVGSEGGQASTRL